MKYGMLIDFLKKVELQNGPGNNREPINMNMVKQMEEQYSGVPIDYFDFLKEVGAGAFRECQFCVYNELLTLEDLDLTSMFPPDINLLIFGDNFSGDLSAFNVNNNYSLVELWHDSRDVYETNMVFKDYIKRRLLMDEDGSDLQRS